MRLAVLHTILARPFGLLFMGVSVAVLARTLTPSTFGLFAISYAAFAILEEVSTFGLKPFLIRTKMLERNMLQNAVALSIVMAIGVSSLVAVALWLLPTDLVPTDFKIALLAFLPILLTHPFAVAGEAMLERNLRFGFISILSAVAALANAVVSVGLALSGIGVLSLVFGFVAEHIVKVGTIFLLVREGRVHPRLASPRALLRFGGAYAASRMLPRLSNFGLLAIIGNALGVATVGLYNRAETLVALADRVIMTALEPTILPILTSAMNSGTARGAISVRMIYYLTAFLWPVFMGMIVLVEPLVFTLLGDQWTGAILPVRILLVGALLSPFTLLSFKLFVAFDQVPQYLRIQTLYQVLRVAFAAIGATQGLSAACMALALADGVKTVLTLRLLSANAVSADHTLSELRGCLLKSALATFVAGVGASAALVLPLPSPALQLSLGIICAALGWMAGLALIRHPLLLDAGALWSRRREWLSSEIQPAGE